MNMYCTSTLTISPVHEKEAGEAGREFFRKEFRSQQFGTPGRWFGSGAATLKLKAAVAETQFRNLLHGRTPDGAETLIQTSADPNRVAAWRLTLTAPKQLSVLWALVPDAERRRIECIHTAAVKRALGSFARCLTGHESGPPDGERAAALFATFRSGADQHQHPDLHSTVFFINLGLQRDGRWGEFSTNQVQQHADLLRCLYHDTLDWSILRGFGPVLPFSETEWHPFGIPAPLCERFSSAPTTREGPKRGLEHEPGKLHHGELFAHWQRQARAFGWGPVRVGSYLRAARGAMAVDKLVETVRQRIHRGKETLQKVTNSLMRWTRGHEDRPKPPRATSSKDQKMSHSY